MSSDKEHNNAKKVFLVGVACGVDMLFNYPLWISAKRLAAGLGLPGRREVYKGVVSVWGLQWPTIACDEFICRHINPHLGKYGDLIGSALAGATGGIVVAAPIECVVTRAHSEGATCGAMFTSILREKGVRGILLPKGQVAIAGREVGFALGMFSVRDRMTKMIHGEKESSGVRWWAEEFVGSMACAAVVNAPSHPASVLLAQQQAYNLSLGEAVRKIHTSAGFRGFYAGFWARCLSIGGSIFVMPPILALEHTSMDGFREKLGLSLPVNFVE